MITPGRATRVSVHRAMVRDASFVGAVAHHHRLQPAADGKRDALIGLLREFADSINAYPECPRYSVHDPIDDEATPWNVIQDYTSVAGFEKHGEWTAPNIPRLVPLLASPPDPPVLLRSGSLGGDPKESFSA
jgi:quinol monooxygenase YgiN